MSSFASAGGGAASSSDAASSSSDAHCSHSRSGAGPGAHDHSCSERTEGDDEEDEYADREFREDGGVLEERDAITLETLFANNVRWARKITQKYPDFFKSLSQMQTPQFLWIGCSDSRVAANEIVGLVPGELFVHRNVANVVCHTDFNCLAVMQYAIDVLKVNTIMVCGHYGCGGVLAAMKHARVGLVDNWLRHVDDVQQKHRKCLDCHTDETEKGDHLCELNVVEQALNVCRNDVVVNAWKRGQDLTVHALIYGMKNGLLRDLNMTVDNEAMVEETYKTAIASLPRN